MTLHECSMKERTPPPAGPAVDSDGGRGGDNVWWPLATFEAGKQACDALRNFWKASGASFFSSANFRATKRFYGEL